MISAIGASLIPRGHIFPASRPRRAAKKGSDKYAPRPVLYISLPKIECRGRRDKRAARWEAATAPPDLSGLGHRQASCRSWRRPYF